MRITIELLKSKGACDSQVARFAELFPDGGDATADKCVAVASEFDWAWVASHLLPASTWADYARVRAAAQAEYARTRTAARAELDRVTVSARAELDRIEASACVDYDRVMALARAEYERLVASAFGELAERTK